MKFARVLAFVVFLPIATSASGQFTFPDFCDVSDFTLNGVTGSLTPNGECVLRLTNALSQSGSAFLTNPVSLADDASFSTAFSFRFTNQQNGGADGIVFVVQTVSDEVGGGGGGIGYQGIEDSVGVEFDNWFNEGSDPDNSHIGIDIDGSVNSVATASVSPDLDNGSVWYAWVDYNGVTDLLEVRISQSPARPVGADLSHTVDLVAVLGQTDAFIGFTSGTGGAAAVHDVLNWAFNPFFDPIGGGLEGVRATFAVSKFFTDGNPGEVEVTINCFTGLPLTQSQTISETQEVEFVVTDFDDGELDCEITEEDLFGYTPTYNPDGPGSYNADGGCNFQDVAFGAENTCHIVNDADFVDVVIEKLWVIEGSGGDDLDTSYKLTLYCDAIIADGEESCYSNGPENPFGENGYQNCKEFYGNGSEVFIAEVQPEYPSSHCWVDETVYDSSVETDNDCGNLVISAGTGDSCVITNTVFYEGIPTLGQYGMAIMALLMLGVGLVGFRRFA